MTDEELRCMETRIRRLTARMMSAHRRGQPHWLLTHRGVRLAPGDDDMMLGELLLRRLKEPIRTTYMRAAATYVCRQRQREDGSAWFFDLRDTIEGDVRCLVGWQAPLALGEPMRLHLSADDDVGRQWRSDHD